MSSTVFITELKFTIYSLKTFSVYWVNGSVTPPRGLTGNDNTLLTIQCVSISFHTNMNYSCDNVSYNHQTLIPHISGIRMCMAAHAGETGLGKYPVAWTVHQRFKDKQSSPEGFIQLDYKMQPKVCLVKRKDRGDGGSSGEEHWTQMWNRQLTST